MVVSLMLCDVAWRDPTSGKWSLFGVCSGAAAVSFPVRLGQLSAYLAITEVHGRIPLQIRLVDAAEANPALWICEGMAEAPDPLTVCEAAWTIKDLTLPAAGEYRLEVTSNGQPIASRRLSVQQIDSAQ